MKTIWSAVLIAAWALIGLSGAGCTTPAQAGLQSQQYTRPQQTISAASALGADKLPQAKLYLRYARDGVAQATQAINQGETTTAKLALERAQADANLALTMTKQNEMARQVHEVNQKIEKLGSQIDQ